MHLTISKESSTLSSLGTALCVPFSPIYSLSYPLEHLKVIFSFQWCSVDTESETSKPQARVAGGEIQVPLLTSFWFHTRSHLKEREKKKKKDFYFWKKKFPSFEKHWSIHTSFNFLLLIYSTASCNLVSNLTTQLKQSFKSHSWT